MSLFWKKRPSRTPGRDRIKSTNAVCPSWGLLPLFFIMLVIHRLTCCSFIICHLLYSIVSVRSGLLKQAWKSMGLCSWGFNYNCLTEFTSQAAVLPGLRPFFPNKSIVGPPAQPVIAWLSSIWPVRPSWFSHIHTIHMQSLPRRSGSRPVWQRERCSAFDGLHVWQYESESSAPQRDRHSLSTKLKDIAK